VPAPAAWGGNASGVEGVGNGAKGRCAGFANFGNDRQDVAGNALGLAFDDGDGPLASVFDVRIA
jgi:hypothetical protein